MPTNTQALIGAGIWTAAAVLSRKSHPKLAIFFGVLVVVDLVYVGLNKASSL